MSYSITSAPDAVQTTATSGAPGHASVTISHTITVSPGSPQQ